MQHARDYRSSSDDTMDQRPALPVQTRLSVRMPTLWVSRITGLISLAFLLLALVLWVVRHGHYRIILLVLTVAMFAAILHSYTFENGTR